MLKMEIDEVYQQIGESGRQQLLYGAALFLLKVYSPFIILQYTFVARSSTFSCSSGPVTLQNECFDNNVRRCTNITFTASTIVSEWSLVCDRNWMAKATMSALMFGFLLGAIMLGNLADRIGRKANLVYTLLGVITFNLVSGLTSSYAVYILTRFLVGFCISGNILSTVVLISELVGSSYRGLYGMVVMGAFPVGIVCLAIVASKLQDWRQLTLFSSLLGMPFILYHWYLVESPRWLLNMNRASEAKRVLNTIAQGNGAKLGPTTNLKIAQTGSLHHKESLRSLFNRKKLVQVLSILCYNWFVNGAIYYGLTLASGEIGSDLYTGFALSGAVELPAVFITYCVIQRAGRRLGLASFMLGSGLSCLLIQLLSRSSYAHLGVPCALLGKMCIAASFKAAYILTGEIFATSIRNSGVGLLSAVARVGSILAPFLVMAGETIPGIQFTIFGILGLSGGFLSLWLPETKDKPLPETVVEMLQEKARKISIQNV